MIEIKPIIGILAVVIAFGSYLPYIRNIYRGHTKPHALTWFGWFLVTAVIFVVQGLNEAGPGAWAMGATAIATLSIAITGFVVGERRYDLVDWFTIGAVVLGIGIWIGLNNPLLAVVIIGMTDALNYIPALRKGLRKPHEETLTTFVLVGIKHLLVIVALQSYVLVNWLYPAIFMVINFGFAAAIYMRRIQHNSAQPKNR